MNATTVYYQVPLYVEVAVEDARVVRVVVGDEETELRPLTPWMDELPQGATPAELAIAKARYDRAVEIAENSTWPVWEFGR